MILLIMLNAMFNQIVHQEKNYYFEKKDELYSLKHWEFSIDGTNNWEPYFWNKIDESYLGERYFRTIIILDTIYKNERQLGLWFMNNHDAFEVYWDDYKIGSNGHFQNGTNQRVYGNYVSIFSVPPQLTDSGKHVLKIHLINNSGRSSLSLSSNYLAILKTIRTIENKESFRLGFLSSLYLMAALLCIILYVSNDRYKPYIMFSLFCFSALILSIRELLLYHYYISNNYFIVLEYLYFIFYPAKCAFLYFFVVDLVGEKTRFFSFGVLFCASFFYSPSLTIYLSIIMSLYVSIFSKKSNSVIFLQLGLILYFIFLLLVRYDFLKHEYGYGAVTLFLSVFFVIGIYSHETIREKEIAKRKLDRLEKDLLKKSIQPHFINNTLLSIINWIRKEPNVAIEMIHSLSEEFDYIISFSKQTKIRLVDEVELCKRHLMIMSRRKEQDYNLQVNNIRRNQLIPPLILHTLIENCITHAKNIGVKIKIYLDVTHSENETCLTLKSLAPDQQLKNSVDGIGYSYIKSRLNETYGAHWRFTHEIIDSYWVEKIWIPNEKNSDC